ncbi:uncharacterized protein AB675_6740 [Cyphellophora attinorum]|uniref:Transcription factor domain-containing protein n=1 Tax=Cyphellophora attinorum TaxID=1664694 RepID=A0A0N0NQB5_9EURO|nr:uncharacterized protein AB675_6740 [Phialophora attinorum]KPI43509.1 hypothetical protein AB675_6740 [Phialophora attinorum]
MSEWGFDLARQAPYLLHTLSAFAALHLQHFSHNKDPELDDLYDHHFHSGIEMYSQALSSEIEPENVDAMFAACMLFAFLAYTAPSRGPPRDTDAIAPASTDLVWLMSQCGFLTLKTTTQCHLSTSIWHDLFAESDSQGSQLKVPMDLTSTPSAWLNLCGIDATSTDANNPYYRALHMLLLIQHIDASKPANFSPFISFPGRMRSEFMELVQQRDKVALLLLAHWLAKMCEMGQWWCDAKVRSECWAICDYLGDHASYKGGCEGQQLLIEGLLRAPMRACGYPARLV